MSKESEEFLKNRKHSEVNFTGLNSGFADTVDQGVLDALAKFRPQSPRILQLEMLDFEDYVIYDYPNQHNFQNWDEDQKGAKRYVQHKLRQLNLDGGETTVQEVLHVAEALLHNYSIMNIDLESEHFGVRRPQCFTPLGLNRAIRETLGDL